MSASMCVGERLPVCNRPEQMILVGLLAFAALMAAQGASAQGGERSGKDVVEKVCISCHGTGEQGAPKIGDRDAWIPRMKHGIDYLFRSAIKGHGAMPARGGMAELTDPEVRKAILYMFNPVAEAASTPGGARSATDLAAARPGKADSNHMTVGGMEIFLGVVSAEKLRAFPKDSPEATMHGGVPKGSGYYHVNVSLFESATNAPVTGAKVDIRVEEVGLSAQSKTLEPMALGSSSYGNYLKMRKNTPYLVTVRVRTPAPSRTIEAKFQNTRLTD